MPTYTEQVAEEIIKTLPALHYKIVEKETGRKHEWKIKTTNDLIWCYAELDDLNALDSALIKELGSAYQSMLDDWAQSRPTEILKRFE